MSLSRQSLALVLTTQNKQEKTHQNTKRNHKTNKLALGNITRKTHRLP